MSDNNLMMTILAGIMMMLVIIIFVIWYFNQGQKKIHATKMLQKEQELTFQKELLISTVKTQETERDRIAAELHDDITSKLNIIHLNIHLLKKRVYEVPDLNSLIDQIEISLAASIERSRSISHELMPQVIKKFGIFHALVELVNSINATMIIEVNMNNEHVLKITDDFKLLHIYRIIQELINNTLKYAGAKKVNINFSESGSHIHMVYEDDGIGFDHQKVKDGLGISNIKTRAQLLEGEVDFGLYQGVNRGICITIKFPNHD